MTWPLVLSWLAVLNIEPAYTLPKVTVICLALLWWSYRAEIRVNTRALAALAWACAVVFWSEDRWTTAFGDYNSWAYGVWPLAVYCCLTGFAPDRKVLQLAGIVLSAAAAYLRFQTGERATIFLGSPVDLGAILAMCTPLAGPWLPVVALGLWATGSRAAWLGAACALLRGRWRWLAVPAVLAAVILPAQPKDLARRGVWEAAALTGLEKPLGAGVFLPGFLRHRGPRYMAAVSNAGVIQQHGHNFLLDSFARGGWLGLVLALWLALQAIEEPALVALLVVLCFDPVAFEVWCLGAMLLPGRTTRVPGFAPAVACGSLLVLAFLWWSELVSPLAPHTARMIAEYNAGMLPPAPVFVLQHPADAEGHYVAAAVWARAGQPMRSRLEMAAARALDPYSYAHVTVVRK